MLISIVEHIDIKKVRSRRDDCVHIARCEVDKDVRKHFIPTFLDLRKDKDIDEETRRSLFLAIVRKTFNSCVGALLRYYKSITIDRAQREKQFCFMRRKEIGNWSLGCEEKKEYA